MLKAVSTINNNSNSNSSSNRDKNRAASLNAGGDDDDADGGDDDVEVDVDVEGGDSPLAAHGGGLDGSQESPSQYKPTSSYNPASCSAPGSAAASVSVPVVPPKRLAWGKVQVEATNILLKDGGVLLDKVSLLR
jgi:hypothetical protein